MNMNHMSSNVTKYLEKLATSNPWKDTILENYYTLNPASKGSHGEKIVEEILKQFNYEVKPRVNAGHDRIVNGVKTEIKFALAVNANSDFKCIFNHVGMEKDWEQLILCCVNGDMEIRMVSFTKDNLPIELWTRQQGGKNGGNDDYMCNADNSCKVLWHENANILI